MTARTGIFAGDDPFALTRSWLAEAEQSEPVDANAIALATVDADGLPNVRIVLLKSIDDDAFVFYTNYESAKGSELSHSAKASFVLYWKSIGRQVRVRGLTEKEDGAPADAYYASRPLGSRIGAWASRQSRPLDSREALLDSVADAERRFGDNPPRPPFWGGYRLRPLEFEFWSAGAYRLHDRFRWRREGLDGPWDIHRLNP